MLLIGMVMFNGFLLAFNVFFPQSPYSTGLYNIENITANETFDSYKHPGILSFDVIGITFATGLTSTFSIAIGLLMTALTRNLQYIAAGAMVAIVSALWTASASIFTDMMHSFPILGAIYTLISIAIGITVAILVLGIFTGQEQLTW